MRRRATCLHRISRSAAAAWMCAAAVLLVQGCAETPQRPAPQPAPIAAPRDVGPVIARDDDFAIVIAGPGETMTVLAERYLDDRSKGWWIAEFNGFEELRVGQTVVIPLRAHNAIGVTAAGYQTIPILCYHRFGPKGSKLNVTAAAFEAQMEFLARSGYTVIPLARLARFLDGKEPLPRKSVAISIDDGYRSTYEVAYPILKKFAFPATVFLYTDFVGAGDALTWAQMKEMTGSGLVEIQPHSKTHANLTLRMGDENEARYRERLRREIDAPVAVIQERVGSRSFTYAYPYGDVNEAAIELLRRQDVRLGVTVTPGGNAFFAYPFLLRRSMVFGNEDLNAFKAKLVNFTPMALR